MIRKRLFRLGDEPAQSGRFQDQTGRSFCLESCTLAFGTHFVEKLGSHQILISRHHGYYALGTTAAEAVFRAYFLRQTCSTQIKTLSMGRPLHLIDPQKVARYQDQMAASPHYNYDGKTEWDGLIRLLDACDPGYKT